ncbi:MAG TPA: sigma-70 family RNA polymerase sigma factor [Hyphomicrobiaceae bacterium]|nr:sigma-70 family RNA polymerase sigma factor [Hyphomicrobiaceae bacterium]
MRLRLAETPKDGPSRRTGSSGDGTDEADLLRRVAGGDQQAFRTLVRRHLPAILVSARRIVLDEAEAEDIAQEALLRLWRGAATLEVGQSGTRPWLRRVATNLAIDRIRARRGTDVVDEPPEVPVAARQQSEIEETEMSAAVHRALAHLPERQRLALTLFHFEGLSQIEVGRALGVSDEAVESLLARARRTLKGELQGQWRELLPGAPDI